MAEPVTPDAIMQLGLAFWGSKALLSAVEMGLFAVLSEAGPLGVVLGVQGRARIARIARR
jgi:hypothetical protein